jgi:hypothetical protein
MLAAPWNFPLYSLGQDPKENTVFYCPVVFSVCLLIRCLTIDTLFLRPLAPARMCLLNRCLAMDLYFTILSFHQHLGTGTGLLRSDFPITISCIFLNLPPPLATRSFHLILHFITLIIFDEKYNNFEDNVRGP